MPSDAQTPNIVEVSTEQAYDMADSLGDKSVFETDAMKVFHGRHEIHGLVYIVIPPLGNSLLLPSHAASNSDRIPPH